MLASRTRDHWSGWLGFQMAEIYTSGLLICSRDEFSKFRIFPWLFNVSPLVEQGKNGTIIICWTGCNIIRWSPLWIRMNGHIRPDLTLTMPGLPSRLKPIVLSPCHMPNLYLTSIRRIHISGKATIIQRRTTVDIQCKSHAKFVRIRHNDIPTTAAHTAFRIGTHRVEPT